MGKTNVPEVRFQGFSREWERKTLGEIADFYKGKGLPKSHLKANGSYKCIHYGELFTEYKENISKIKSYTDEKKDYFYSVSNDVLMPTSDVTPNGLATASCIKESGIILGGDILVIRISPNVVDGIFLSYYVAVKKKEIMKLVSGTTVYHLYGSNMTGFEVNYHSTSEQTKIGNYLKNLDKLITLKQRKLDKLKNVKKSMLEKMFPRKGATVPEIRFQGFSGEWERKTLGEIMSISSAARVHKHQWTNKGVPFFRSSDVVSAFKGEDNNKAYISPELYESLSNKIGYVSKNDILMTGGGSIGIPYLVKDNNPLYFKDADLLWLKSSDVIDGSFLFSFFHTRCFRKYLSSITHIGTIAHYTIEQAKVSPIRIPSLPEQTKIGTYFKNLDKLITLQYKEIEKLKQIKSSCLSKMFV